MLHFPQTPVARLNIALKCLAAIILTLTSITYSQEPQNTFPLARLTDSKSWMWQIQSLDLPGSIESLARTEIPLLVLDPTSTIKGCEGFDTAGMVQKLKVTPQGKHRILLAYINIGQAENYRSYWTSDWKFPQKSTRGAPDFLLAMDDAGWQRSCCVSYWDPRWKAFFLGPNGLAQKMAECGFDGVYLDWVEAYDDPSVIAAAQHAGVNAGLEMIRLIEEIRKSLLSVLPECVVICQDAIYLVDKSPDRYFAAVDGIAAKATWFSGQPDVPWGSPRGGDIPNKTKGNKSTEARLKQFNKLLRAGKAVFTVDFCLNAINAQKAIKAARAAGLRPLVTRTSLSHLSEFALDYEKAPTP